MIRACFFGSEIWGSLLELDAWNATMKPGRLDRGVISTDNDQQGSLDRLSYTVYRCESKCCKL
jgi:hypothetical protein